MKDIIYSILGVILILVSLVVLFWLVIITIGFITYEPVNAFDEIIKILDYLIQNNS